MSVGQGNNLITGRESLAGQYCGGHSGNLSLSDWYNNISYGRPNKRMMGKLRVDHS